MVANGLSRSCFVAFLEGTSDGTMLSDYFLSMLLLIIRYVG
jgi:hypothetical protein